MTTRDLATFLTGLRFSDLPDEVVHEAKRALVDWSGVALAGSQHASAGPVMDLVTTFGVPGDAPVIGSSMKATPPYAALANGYLGHLLDFDDTYQPARTTVHGSSPAWSTIIASAGEGTDGMSALAAFVAGFETECRAGLAAGPAHYERGWHVTGTVGHFGAAAAAGKLAGLGTDDMVAALGTAGTQAAGLKEVYGSTGKPLHPGKAAMDGVLSVFLVQRGFTSTETIFEGPRGFLAVLSDEPDAGELTNDLGSYWCLLENSHKPFACGSLTHPTMEAVLRLRADHDIDPADVESITATVHSYVSWVTAKDSPVTGLQGKFSIFHAAAVAMVDGEGLPAQFTDERVQADDVQAMRARVGIEVDDTLPKEGARLTIALSDGSAFEHEVLRNKGASDNPLSDDDLQDKFLGLAAPVLGEQAALETVASMWDLERSDDVRSVFTRLAVGA
jgi:2-methylcitrate dehydratase PrpD